MAYGVVTEYWWVLEIAPPAPTWLLNTGGIAVAETELSSGAKTVMLWAIVSVILMVLILIIGFQGRKKNIEHAAPPPAAAPATPAQ